MLVDPAQNDLCASDLMTNQYVENIRLLCPIKRILYLSTYCCVGLLVILIIKSSTSDCSSHGWYCVD